MRRLLLVSVLSGSVLTTGACLAPVSKLTYDRYDEKSNVYVNDTVGFALRLGDDWRVRTDAQGEFQLLTPTQAPSMDNGNEVTLQAVARHVGLVIETRKVQRSTSLEKLQPSVFKTYENAFKQLRYRLVSLEKKVAHGIEYMEWVYELRTPDMARTVVEGLFLRDNYAVRMRALASTERFEQVRGRIAALYASLTRVDPVRDPE
ncbi:MAG: hypothetical protein AB2A00_32580 [Myxococcota bacterium]